MEKSSREAIHTDLENGLTSEEAKQRLEQYGRNELEGSKSKSLLSRLFSQINDVLIYVLIAAAGISAMLGEVTDAFIIGLVVVINAVVGVIQETKAEGALEALQNMTVPKAIVRRDGVQKEIPSQEVVPGDVVLLDAGRFVPCDLQLVETVNVKIEEAALTGESVPVEKDAKFAGDETMPIGDRKDLAFMSTFTTNGRAVGVATHTGMRTEIGKVATMLKETVEVETPLQKSLAVLGKYLGLIALAICLVIFVVGIFQGRELLEMFMLAVSLAVAAIPEGLPAIVSIVLAIGVQRMIKQNVIIRKLPAVEALGSVNVICSDKTGTLTQNRMTVTTCFVDQQLEELSGKLPQNQVVSRFFETMALCNDASISKDGVTGDPTEIALITAAQEMKMDKQVLEKTYPRVDEIPFDSTRKLMTTVNQRQGEPYGHTKGAIDRLLPLCTSYETSEGIFPMDDAQREKISHAAQTMSKKALRVLGMAYKKWDGQENELTFLGLTGMIDPPREEVKEAIEITKTAGITTVMITGDHKDTAFAIAYSLGIAENESEVMEGSEIDDLTKEQLMKKSETIRVYARVSPEHKVKIVQAIQATGKTASMTGDGVNDAPSLKAADIGVAMGITGTDVAQGAADMVLTDDNFTSIVKAVEEGRTIYRNIKKTIIFLLSCNIGEIIALFAAILLGFPAPLRPIHILWVNLVTDTFPALSLGVDPESENVMNDPPRGQKESIFKGMKGFLIANGFLIAILTLIGFVLGVYMNETTSSLSAVFSRENMTEEALIHGQTMAFLILSFSQLAHSFNFRAMGQSVFKAGIFKNKFLNYSVLLGIALQVTIVMFTPIANIFSVRALGLTEWLLVVGFSLTPLILNELWKLIKK